MKTDYNLSLLVDFLGVSNSFFALTTLADRIETDKASLLLKSILVIFVLWVLTGFWGSGFGGVFVTLNELRPGGGLLKFLDRF